MSDDSSRLVTGLTCWTLAGSVVFFLSLGTAFWFFHSNLALAQAADSLLDITGAAILAWTVRVAARPGDDDHPLGHARAEPLGALAIAVLAGILAVEVCTVAVDSLLAGSRMEFSLWLLAAFAVKAIFKLGIYLVGRRHRGPAIEALTMDARNDVLVGCLAFAGFLGARLGLPVLDPLLALPVGVWIGWSGINLARENIDLLMGRAPSAERQCELLALAEETEGVLEAHDLRAQHLGPKLSVYIHITVAAELSVLEAHDIGRAVRLRFEAEDDVLDCAVHVDPARPRPSPGPSPNARLQSA